MFRLSFHTYLLLDLR